MKKNYKNHSKDRLQHGLEAVTPQGFKENIKTMEKAGYSKKRSVGTAYGEADMAYDELQDMVKKL